MAKWYLGLSETKKNVFLLSALTVLVFLCLSPFFFFDGGCYPLGWLLGSAVGILAYLSIVQTSKFVLSKDSKTTGTLFTVLFVALRYILYAAGLGLGAICTFKPEWFGGFNAFNFYTVMAGYLPFIIIVPINSAIMMKNRKPEATPLGKDSGFFDDKDAASDDVEGGK